MTIIRNRSRAGAHAIDIAIAVLLLGCTTTVPGDGPGDASLPTDTQQPPALTEPITILGEGPYRAFHTSANFQAMKDAGFTVAIPAMDVHQSSDMSNMLSLANDRSLGGLIIDQRLIDATSGSNVAANVDAAVASYKSAAGLRYYGIVDEPSAARFADLAVVVQALKEKDPDHPAYINLFPDYATTDQLGTASYSEYVSQFVSTVHPSLLSFDYYPFLHNGDDRVSYFQNLDIIRDAALENNIPFIVWIQSFGGGDAPNSNIWRKPNFYEKRLQAMVTLAYGAKGIGWFRYWFGAGDFSTGMTDGVVNGTGGKTSQYEEVSSINTDMRAAAKYLGSATSTAVWHNGSPFPGTSGRPSGSPVYVVGDNGVVVGEFSLGADTLVLLVCRSYTVGCTSDVWFRSANGRPRALTVSTDSFATMTSTASVGTTLARVNQVLPIAGWQLVYLEGPIASAAGTDTLPPNGHLFPGDVLQSQDGRFALTLERNGNVVLRQTGTVLWQSATSSAAPRTLSMESSGNLAIYDNSGAVVTATGTSSPGAFLKVQNDGNVVLYASNGTTVLWQTNTGER